MTNFFSRLRVRLIFFVLIAALPALALTLYTGLEAQNQAGVEAQNEALRLVRFAAVNQEFLIQNTRGILVALAHALGVRDDDLSKCGIVFSHLQDSHFPYYSAFYIADTEGNILCNIPNSDIPPDLVHCEHFQNLLQSDEFVVSEYHICKNTGEAVVSMGASVRDSQDQVLGVINVGLDLAWFNQLASDSDLPPGSTLTVFDRSGVVLAHYPDPENWVGKNLPESSVFQTIHQEIEGTTEGLGTDGIRRLFAFVALSGTNESVFISIGIPADLAYAEAGQTMTRNLILLAVVTLLALGTAWVLGDVFVLKKTQALVNTTQQLAAGQLDARTRMAKDGGEFGLLAEAIDEMAESLAAREAERNRTAQVMQEYAEDLERSNRDLLDFANIASHDMREPLRKILIFGDLLETRYTPVLDERGRDYIHRMGEAARRMQALLTGLLAYSRISTKGEPFSEVNLDEVAKNVLAHFEVQIEEQKAQIQLEKLPTIQADETQMHQLLQNLISNALKFHAPDRAPIVQISYHTIRPESTADGRPPQDPRLEIHISDNGIGFDEKYKGKIFLPFQRLYGRSQFEGTGLGLAICEKIVTRHGGCITAQSKPGQGSTFIISLPNHARPAGDKP